jgi:hypothetical protein
VQRLWELLGTEDLVYGRAQPYAKNIKALVQVLIGVGVAVIVIIRTVYGFTHPNCAPLAEPPNLQERFCYPIPDAADVLGLISDGLATAAVIELAYTFFTEGPDEALDPLILGVSAVLLVEIGKNDFFSQGVVSFVLLTLGLTLLFLVRMFLAEVDGKESLLSRLLPVQRNAGDAKGRAPSSSPTSVPGADGRGA